MPLFGGSKKLVGLDIGSTSVKVVELSVVGGGLVISGMGSAEIETPEMLGDAIQTALREAGIKTKKCVSSVSGRSVIFRQVSMVEMSDGDLRQAVEYEADKYIPFEVGEVELDAQRMEEEAQDDSGQMKVLLVAVKKVLIEEHINLLQSMGMVPRIVDVDVFALGNAFELRNLSLGINDDEVRALVDIGASKTNINIMRGNKSFFHREIYVAGNDLTDAVAKRFGEDPKDVERMKKDPGGALESMQDAMLPVLEDIGNEIKLSFDYYENQYDQEVKEVFLSGGTVFFPGVDTMLGQIFNLPAKVWDPTEGLEITNFNPSGMGGTNSDMAIALGLASRLISKVGKVSAVATTARAGDVATDAPSGAVTTAPVQRTGMAGGSGNWTKGIGVGTAVALGVAVILYFANTLGYQKWWVIFEGLLLGVPAGFGLWQAIKDMRPMPSRGGIVVASVLIAAISAGGLLGARFATDKPITKPRERRPAITANLKLPGLSPEEQKKELARRKNLKKRKKSFNLDQIKAILFVFAHGVLTAFCCLTVANVKLKKLESEERTVII